jgi:hypothetical protein
MDLAEVSTAQALVLEQGIAVMEEHPEWEILEE